VRTVEREEQGESRDYERCSSVFAHALERAACRSSQASSDYALGLRAINASNSATHRSY
jgi:hypothetical protein